MKSLRPWHTLLGVFICGVIYVSQYWSPSSYGTMLDRIGLPGAGLIYGEARPIRSDEWAVVTPLTQATVNNDFHRFNETSFYKEDLRINYGLPIFDWGMVFKPTMWAYFFVEPARAYSFHWFGVLAMFVVGHALLFRRLGLGTSTAILLSAGLYFTGFTQFWWNEKGPVFAFFPWVIWVLMTSWPVAARLALCYWLGASWLITNFYPPLFLSLAFVGALWLFAFDRRWFCPGRLVALLATAAAAGLTAAFYLQNYLLKTAATIYPGQRNGGGGGVPWAEWWAQLFPFATFDWAYESVIGQNICEVGVVGAAFLLMTACFVDHRRALELFTNPAAPERRGLLVLGAGLLLMYMWMLLPLPAWVGMPLLWNHVQPERMEYAAGFVLLIWGALIGKGAGWVITWQRVMLYMVLVLAGWISMKGIGIAIPVRRDMLLLHSNDLVVIPALLLFLLIARVLRLPSQPTLLAASAASGAVVLFGFNPIQSAEPIFARVETPFIRALESDIVKPSGVLATPGDGATLNGLGFASVAHVTAVPALAYWRAKYPAMPEAQFLSVFNRYSHVKLTDDLQPNSPFADQVAVPLKDFWPDRVTIPKGELGRAQAVWLEQGKAAQGRILPGRNGEIDDLRVFIGTGSGKADGVLHLRACSEKTKSCTQAESPLANAQDNSYLHFQFDHSIRLDHGDALTYELLLDGGKNAVALWTYPSDAAALEINGEDRPGSTARFLLNFRSDTQ